MLNMRWIYDSHIHLSDPEYSLDLKSILHSMKILHIKACCVSMTYNNSKQTLELSKYDDNVFPFIGIHPENSDDDLDNMVTLIEENSKKNIGIGEIGLDKSYSNSTEEFVRQQKVFTTLLSLAEKYQKPVSIHSRKTLNDIFEILPSYSLKGVLLHWFDGNKRQLQKAMDLGYFVSYGPVLLYANDKQTLLSKTNTEQILLETDGPVRFSRCFESKPAQVSFIPSIVFCASKILKKTYDELSEILEHNSQKYLGISNTD